MASVDCWQWLLLILGDYSGDGGSETAIILLVEHQKIEHEDSMG